jgi:PAS domain S-box-containing protein
VVVAWAALLRGGALSEHLLLVALCYFLLAGACLPRRNRTIATSALVGVLVSALASTAVALDSSRFGLVLFLYFLASTHTAFFANKRGVAAQIFVSSAGYLAVVITLSDRTREVVDWVVLSATLTCLSLAVYFGKSLLEALMADLSERAAEHQVIASLSQRAIAELDLESLIKEVCETIVSTLQLERVVVFENLPSGEAQLLRAAAGELTDPPSGDLALGHDSFSGYTIGTGEPVVVDDLALETRFAPTPFLLERGVISAVNVVIPSRTRPWGVLGVRTTARRRFDEADIDFLRALANVIGSSVEQRENEEALRASRVSASELSERLSAVIDGAAAAVIQRDLEGRVQIWNRGAEETFAWPREEVIGKAPPIVPESLVEEYTELLRRAGAGASIVDHETTLRRRDGSEIPCAISVAPLHDDEGRVGGTISIIIDLSVRRLAEQELSRSRELYRLLVENSHDMIAVLDPMGRFVFASPSYEDALGYNPEELIDVSPISLVHPSDVQRASDALRQVVTDRETALVELRMRHKRGSWVFVEGTTTAVTDESGELQSILMSFRDISERRVAEEELREAESRYRLLVEQLPLVTYVELPTPSGRWIYLSPQLEEMLGFKPSEWTSDFENFVKAIHPDDRERVSSERAASSKGRIALEYRLIAKDERTVWVHDEAVVVRDLSGKPIYVQGYIVDISAEQAAEEERARLEAQLLHSQKMEAVGRLAGGIAHDFNNLLTAITGYTELIASELDPSSSLARDAEEIRRAAEQAAAMTQQLLAFSRRQVLQPTLLNVSEVVDRMEKMLKRLIGEDIRLINELDHDLPTVRSDRGQIEQVIMNLIVNSRDAMPNGGSIRITTSAVEMSTAAAAKLSITPGAYVKLTVSDTGSGIDAETISHIFEPFFTTKEQGKGTGLGLATVHGIVEQSGGTIEISSTVDEGSSFSVYLPVESAEPGVEEKILSLGDVHGSETLMLVEDEDMVRQLVSRILKELGYQVYEAANGEDALTLSESLEQKIDLLLTDVVMPGMSGRELAEHLVEARPTTRVLFMSGYTEEAIVHHGVSGGNTEFIGKPFTPQELAQKIRSVLASNEPHGTSEPQTATG